MRARARISTSRGFCGVHRTTKKDQREFSNRKSSADSRQTLRSRTAASIARLIPGFRLTVQRDTPSSSAISWKLDAPRAMAITARAMRSSSLAFGSTDLFRDGPPSMFRTMRFRSLIICCASDCVACISHSSDCNKKRSTELMQAARQTFFDSGFPVCIDFCTSLASTCEHLCKLLILCQQMMKKFR